MSYHKSYVVTQADKDAFQKLGMEDGGALLRHLQWHRYQLAFYARDLATKKPIDKDAILTAFATLPELLEEKGLHDLSSHLMAQIANLRNYIGLSSYSTSLEAGEVSKTGFHIKNAEDQLGGVFGGVGGKPMSRTPGEQDAEVDHAHKKFVAAIEAEALERYVQAMKSWRLQQADIEKQHTQLFSKVQDFLKKLPEADLTDVLFHALDENQPLPPTINHRVRTTLGDQAVRDMIVASINGPQTLLEAIPHAIGSVVTGKPMFSVETDLSVVSERLAAIRQERKNAPGRGDPVMGGR